MDNFFLRMDSQGTSTLKEVLAVMLPLTDSGGICSHYWLDNNGLSMWYSDTDFVLPEHASTKTKALRLPFVMNVEMVIAFVTGWWKDAPITDPCPSLDGSVGRGWALLMNRNDGRFVLAIRPIWAEFHK